MKVELSKSQCRNIADFIEFHFIESIRNDDYIDNIRYVADVSKAYEILKEAGGNEDA
jgi:hypothetical protein